MYANVLVQMYIGRFKQIKYNYKILFYDYLVLAMSKSFDFSLAGLRQNLGSTQETLIRS